MFQYRNTLLGFVIVLQSCASGIGAQKVITPNPETRDVASAPTIPAALPPQPRIILRPGELVLAADEDDIPPIFAAPHMFSTPSDGRDEWRQDDLVLGIMVGGESRAYPIRLLSLHEVINDTVGGQPLIITWCPLCYTAIVYERELDSVLTFGASGYLYKNNLVMLDHQTGTLWSQALGVALRGARRGDRLRMLPSNLTTLADWVQGYPATLILSARQLGYRDQALIDPYTAYYESGAAGLTGRTVEDDRLALKALVAGITAGGSALAIPIEQLVASGWVQESVGGRPVVLSYDAEGGTLRAYLRKVDGQTIAFNPGAIEPLDMGTGSLWDLMNGRALSGPSRGTQLEPYPVLLIYWFAWVDLHPDTRLHPE